MNKEALPKSMSPLKEAIVNELMLMCKVTLFEKDTVALSAVLHALIGIILMNKEEEFGASIEPYIESLKVEALKLIAEIEGTDKPNQMVEDDDLSFFDRNDIIL